MLYDVVQIAGSLLILTAFVAAMFGRLRPSGYRYLVANALGSAVLTVTAVAGREWGFILLEGVWALVSVYSVVRKAMGREPAAPQYESWRIIRRIQGLLTIRHDPQAG